MFATDRVETTGKQSQEHHERIEQALAHILRTPRFKDSQQLQSLLRYVVGETLNGNEDGLKERLIGIYVFARRPDYDTTNDPIVRSRMGLLRRRLAQYYESEEGEQASVQIVIPNGTYRPGFVFQPVTREKRAKTALGEPTAVSFPPADDPVAILPAAPRVVPQPDSATAVPHSFRAEWLSRALAAAAVIILVCLMAWWSSWRTPQGKLAALWAPIVSGTRPIYIYTGSMRVFERESPPDEATSAEDLHSPLRLLEPPSAELPQTADHLFFYGEGMLTGSVYADIRVSAFLNKYNRTPILRTGPNLPYMDLKGSPLILIGSFDNYWTRVMNESLPFYFDRGFGIRERDGKQRRWQNPLKAEMTPLMMEDYALIFRVMDSRAGAPVLAIAGLSTCGTHAAADFVTDPAQMNALPALSRADLKSKNIELVLHTSLVNCAPTSVQVIASKVW